jgi:GT2 family glycosyltransferase
MIATRQTGLEIDSPAVSVGIVTWRAKEMLRGLLDSLLTARIGCPYEIIVVDNASGDGTVDMLRTEYPGVRLICNDVNEGAAPARNQIFTASRGDYVLLLDVDTLVQSGAIDNLVETMERHPDAAIGGPKLVYEDGRLQLSCRPFPSLLNIVVEGTFLREWFPRCRLVKEYTMEEWDHSEMREVDWMYGACLIVRREALRTIGMFDERFFYLYEDVDLCHRARGKGFKVLYIPQAEVVHFLRREQKGVFHPRIGTHIKSICRYLMKNRHAIPA